MLFGYIGCEAKIGSSMLYLFSLFVTAYSSEIFELRTITSVSKDTLGTQGRDTHLEDYYIS
jgi:hypothetical protein